MTTMKKITTLLYCILFLIVSHLSVAQVGIGTNTPNGILDITSSQYGVVYPSVALTANNVAAPVVNPLGGALAVGTTIYNTATTNTGANDVEPGIYSWNGSKWETHFFIRQHELHQQTASLRSSSLLGFQAVPGLGPLSFKTFTAKYSGLYRIEVRVNYGGGKMVNNGDVNTSVAQGDFRFIFNGNTHTIPIKSFSTYTAHVSGGKNYTNIWSQTYKTIYINLVAGTTYNFSLEFDQAFGTGFEANGDLLGLLDGRGYVGTDIPCFVEISYIDEN
jgi:hypothetical protein